MNSSSPAIGRRVIGYRLPITLALLLGIGLRTFRLGWQPIWWDEGYSIYFATESIPHMLSLTARDIHPPLYYALLHAWINLTGSTDPATLRILSIIIGALALPTFAWLVHTLFRSPPRTLIATLLLAVSPMHIFYSHELRMYGLALWLGLIATAFLWQLTTRPTRRNILLYALAVSLTLYTTYYSAFLILAHAIWVGWRFYRARYRYKPVISAYAIAALLYLPWISYSAANLIRYIGAKVGFDNDTPLAPLTYLWRHLLAFTSGHLAPAHSTLTLLSLSGVLGIMLLLGIAITARFGSATSTPALGENDPPRNQIDHAVRPAIWICFAIPLVIGFGLNSRLPFFPDGGERLLLFVLPYFLLIVADGIVSLSGSLRWAWKPRTDAPRPRAQSTQNRVSRKSMEQVSSSPQRIQNVISGIALLCFLLASGVGIFNFYTIGRYTERDYRPIIRQIVQQGRDEDALLAIFPWQVGYWRAYAPTALHTQDPLLLGQTSLEWSGAIRRQIDDRLAEGGTLWFPAPLALGSNLPLEIERHLQQSPRLSNVEMAWENETTRLSAWQQFPEIGADSATAIGADFGSSFGTVQLVAASVHPAEVVSANQVLHVATEWLLAENEQDSSAGVDAQWQMVLQLVDERERVWSRRTVRMAGGAAQSMAGAGLAPALGILVPTGLPPDSYRVRVGVDRISVRDGSEEVIPQYVQPPMAPESLLPRASRFVSLGEVMVRHPAEPVATYRLPIDHDAVPVAMADALSLVGVAGIDPGRSALAGTRIGIDIFIQNQSAAPPRRDLYVSLLDDAGAGVAGGEGWPLAAIPTDGLAAGALLQVPFEVELPATLSTGDYRLIGGWLDPATGEKSAPAGLGVVRVVQRAAVFTLPDMVHSLQPPALFGAHAELIGYDMVVVDAEIGLTLYWRVEQSLLPPHNIFVHVVTESGESDELAREADNVPVAQWDGVPQSVGAGGELVLAPTGSWRTGEFLATRHRVARVDGANLALRVGLYVPESGVRLPVARGGEVVGDFVRLDLR